MQSEISQKEKNKHHLLMHPCGSRRMLHMTLFEKQNGDTDVGSRRADTEGVRGA